MRRNLLILLILITLFTIKAEATPNNTSIIFEKIDSTKVYLIGRINNWDNVSEYGFAYSNFPLPPILDQEVTYLEIEGKPYKRDTFSIYINDLEQGKNYFFSTYDVINGKYYYSSNYSYSTPKKIKLEIENKIIEYTTEEIELPINIIKSREVGFGELKISFDEKLYFRDFILEGAPEGSYTQSQIKEQNGKKVLTINFFFNEDIPIIDLKMNLVYQLDRTIKTSGYYSIEFENVSLYETNGKKIESDIENGAIHYQFKGDGVNKYDKLFSDDDLVYYKSIDEEAELIYIDHSNQIITSRWKMGISSNTQNESRIEVTNNYYVNNETNYEKDIVEAFSLRLSSSQKEDLLDAKVDFFYTNPLGVIFKLSKADIEEISQNPRSLEIETTTLPDTLIRQMGKEPVSVIKAYQVKAEGVRQAELRFPIKESIPKKDVRVEIIDSNGNEKRVIPYYISKPGENRLACIEVNPNATFIFTAPNVEVVETTLSTDVYYHLDKVYELNANSYLNIDGSLMLPAKILREFFNVRLSWDSKREQLEVYDGKKNIFSINSNVVLVDNAALFIKGQPEFLNGNVFLPEEAFEKILNANITYNKREGNIIIKYKK